MHGIPFEETRIPLYTESSAREIAKYSDAGKVPVLLDGDFVVWDSLAILEYVSERYLDGKGWPGDLAARAEARAASAEMHAGFPELRKRMPFNCRATGRAVTRSVELDRDIARIDRLWSALRHKYASEGPWLFGTFSIADCMYAPVASRFETYGVTLSATSAQYARHILAEPVMREWMDAAKREPEVIPASEVGM